MFAAVGVGDQYQPSGLETNMCSQIPFFGIFVLLYIFTVFFLFLSLCVLLFVPSLYVVKVLLLLSVRPLISQATFIQFRPLYTLALFQAP